MPDLRQIDADFRRILGEAYRPLCWWDGCWFIGRESIDLDAVAEAMIGWAAAQAWANTTVRYVGGDWHEAHERHFVSLSALHAAVIAWERTKR